MTGPDARILPKFWYWFSFCEKKKSIYSWTLFHQKCKNIPFWMMGCEFFVDMCVSKFLLRFDWFTFSNSQIFCKCPNFAGMEKKSGMLIRSEITCFPNFYANFVQFKNGISSEHKRVRFTLKCCHYVITRILRSCSHFTYLIEHSTWRGRLTTWM